MLSDVGVSEDNQRLTDLPKLTTDLGILEEEVKKPEFGQVKSYRDTWATNGDCLKAKRYVCGFFFFFFILRQLVFTYNDAFS